MARNARPSAVKWKSPVRLTMTPSAVDKQSSGITPMATSPPSVSEAVSSAPTCSRRVSAENSSSRPFCTTIDRPKVISSGGSPYPSGRPVEQHRLQQIADRKHQRRDDGKRQHDIEAGPRGEHQQQERRHDDQIAMRQIDEPHDPEDERKPGGVQSKQAAQQHALQQGIEPTQHPSEPEIGGVDRSWLRSRGAPVSATRPSCKQ